MKLPRGHVTTRSRIGCSGCDAPRSANAGYLGAQLHSFASPVASQAAHDTPTRGFVLEMAAPIRTMEDLAKRVYRNSGPAPNETRVVAAAVMVKEGLSADRGRIYDTLRRCGVEEESLHAAKQSVAAWLPRIHGLDLSELELPKNVKPPQPSQKKKRSLEVSESTDQKSTLPTFMRVMLDQLDEYDAQVGKGEEFTGVATSLLAVRSAIKDALTVFDAVELASLPVATGLVFEEA